MSLTVRLTCSRHPRYRGWNVPAGGCQACWQIYELLHGENYAEIEETPETPTTDTPEDTNV